MDQYNSFTDITYRKFLIIRAGNTLDRVIPLPKFVFIKGNKKERKIIIYGPSKIIIRNMARLVYTMRPPSLYTGRGVKFKRFKVKRRKIRKTRAGGRMY